MRGARWDALIACGAGATALAVYVRTLAPGLVAVLDTPMFQFIGRVLGVPHNPGYPLYVLLTHPVSRLPAGSLAYRLNLFSAALGAVAVSLTYLLARRLGCRRVLALAAALGLAFGRVFWSQAVIAEVYSLHAALVAGMLLALMAWRQTRRTGLYFVAVALFAAGLGNHTTIVAFAPGMLLFAFLTDRRFILRLRTVVLTGAILAAGLLQYAFILIRSRQPGAYVESRATTAVDVVRVALGAQFSDRLFAFDVHALVRERLPSLFDDVLVAELTLVGLALAAAGTVWLLRRRAEALLLLPALVLILAFALNYRVVDTPVFLIPAFLVLWLAAAAGAEQAARAIGRWPAVAAACSVAALGLPAWNLASNFAVNDRSRDVNAAVQFDALFDALPARAALVREDFLVDRMVMYKLLGERAARGRRISPAPARSDFLVGRLDAGFGVFAFPKSAQRMRHAGLNFGFEPLRLVDGTLSQYLDRLPDGAVVAVAVPASLTENFLRSGGADFTAIGGPPAPGWDAQSSAVVVGVRGGAVDARVESRRSAINLQVSPGRDFGASSAIQAVASADEAAIRLGSRDLVRTRTGIALAVWTPDGRLDDTLVLEERDGFRVPLQPGPLSVYLLRGRWSSRTLGEEWTDVTPLAASGSLMIRMQPGSALELHVADDAPLAPRVFDRSSGSVRVNVASLESPGTMPEGFVADGRTQRAASARYAYRIEARVTGARAASALIALGGVPASAEGRLTTASSDASLFRIETDGLLRTPDSESEVLLMARDEQAQLVGAGWSAVDWDAIGPYRWLTSGEARLVLPVAKGTPRRIRVQALKGRGDAVALRIRLNGAPLHAEPLHEGWHTYEWSVPPGTLVRGVNEIALALEPGGASAPGDRGVAVSEVRLTHAPR